MPVAIQALFVPPAMPSRIDHVMIVTPDLEATRREFEALGFTVTPRARHPKFGTANHLCVLQDDYIELLGLDPQAEPGAQPYGPVAAAIGAGGGVPMVALGSEDAHAFAASLRAAGIPTDDPLTWSRDADTPAGRVTATFTTFLFDAQSLPGFVFFCCQQHTRQAVWCPPWMQHANGATGVLGVRREWPSAPADLAQRYRRLAGALGVTQEASGLKVDLGGADVAFRTVPGQERTVVRLARRPGAPGPAAGVAIPLSTVAHAALEWSEA